MNNVITLFKEDLKALKTNVIAAIVALGLALVPPMYAWLTTLGFWDPYSNTGNIMVAVANEDEGYSSTLIPTKIDAGKNIVNALHENDGFDWVFVDKDEAVDGVYSGEYYAAIVIPKDFSHKLMTVFSDDVQKAEIDYYTNQKTNAIAPRVTDAGATELQTQIDETFTETVASIALSTTTSLTDFFNGDSISNYGKLLEDELDNTTQALGSAIDQVGDISLTLGAIGRLIGSSAGILEDSSGADEVVDSLLSDTSDSLSAASTALGRITDQINSGIDQANSAFDAISDAIDRIFDSASDDPAQMKDLINDLSQNIANMISIYSQLRTDLQNAGVSQDVISGLDSAILELMRLQGALTQASDDIDSMATDKEDSRAKVEQELNEARSGTTELVTTLEQELKGQISTLTSELSSLRSNSGDLGNKLDDLIGNMKSTATSLSGDLAKMQTSLSSTEEVLRETLSDLEKTKKDLDDALNKGDLDEVRRIIGNNPEAIASFLSDPTVLDKHIIYEMNSNGSSMSAFYTSLSLWIGAIFLVALTNVVPSKKRLATLKDPKPWQTYLGRFGVFGCIAIFQGIIVCIGNVFFVGVQCEHFWLYLLACTFCGLVFSSFVYTLTVCFGSIGKAIAIIMLVMQLGGSGGIFPIQMSAPIFQAIYPWLPFSHSMEAFQGCIAGIYGMQYWSSMFALLLFMVVSFVMGMVLDKPLLKANAFIMEKMEETEVL